MQVEQTAPIHVHDVIKALEKNPMTEDDLRNHFQQSRVEAIKFCSCSQQNMPFEQMLVFLLEKQKIEEIEGQLHFTGKKCSH